MVGSVQYAFPSDIMDAPEYGQMMMFSAYTPQSARVAAAQQTVALTTNNFFNRLPDWWRTPLFGENAGRPLSNPLPSPTRQLLATIFIYVPSGGQDVNLSWQQEHMYTDIKLSKLATGAAAGLIGGITGVDPATLSNAAGLTAQLFRTQINPYVEVLYSGTKLRSFNFSFMLAPQSAKDAEQLYGTGINGDGLLNTFRYHAAPEFSGTANAVMTSPSEWEIDFFYRSATTGGWAVNDRIPKVAKGILQRVDVDYNPDTEFSTFENGGPTSSRLSMNFVEMEIIDKTRIREGY